MFRSAVLAAAAALLLGVGVAAAEPAHRPKAVIELFTSQGCSSCPPADALFESLAKEGHLVTVTYPVTYWDYLGWKDTLGQEAFTKRQKLYAKARGDGQVYTPQAVVNGSVHLVGSDKAEIGRHVAAKALTVGVSLSERDGQIAIALSPASVGAEPVMAGVWLLPITRSVTVPIGRGENKGRSVTYANVVRDIVRVGSWDGREATLLVSSASARAEGADGYVVIVQTEQTSRYGALPSAIVGAAQAGR